MDDSEYTDIVKAIHAYMTNEPTCLALRKGDVIYVYNKDKSGWWDGVCRNKRGNKVHITVKFTVSFGRS